MLQVDDIRLSIRYDVIVDSRFPSNRPKIAQFLRRGDGVSSNGHLAQAVPLPLEFSSFIKVLKENCSHFPSFLVFASLFEFTYLLVLRLARFH